MCYVGLIVSPKKKRRTTNGASEKNMKDYLYNSTETKEYRNRFKILYSIIAITGCIFLFRLWYLQIIMGNELRELSVKNRIKATKLPAPRGLILDRNQNVLVENIPAFEITISPQYTENIQKTAKYVSKIINIPASKIVSLIKKSRRLNGPFFPAKIKENLSRREIFLLKRIRLDNPGLEISEVILRKYTLNENGSQLFGYVGEISKKQIPLLNRKYKGKIKFKQGDIVGQSGIEESLEANLKGFDGRRYQQVDARGREAKVYSENVFDKHFTGQESKPGTNLVLTIDKDIQTTAYNSFVKNKRIGSLVAIKNNGEVLAWLSTPSFNPNSFVSGISNDVWSNLINDPFKPLRNKVIQDHNSPGSTFKPLIALAALQEKMITDQTTIYCNGHLKYGRRIYHDWKRNGHGTMNLSQAIEQSCNVFFYKMGILLGIDKMKSYIDLFHIGRKTGIEIEGEVPGLMPDSAWKLSKTGEAWQLGENLTTAIGQGFVLTTPLQMAIAYNAIGLMGKIYKPFIIKELRSYDNKIIKEIKPLLLKDISIPQQEGLSISKKNFAAVKHGLWLTANGKRGTAKWWKIPGVEIAGKTGTSQVRSWSASQIYSKCEDRPIKERHHGWFVGFAPAENPVITVAVLAEHSCHGSSGAAPIVRDVIKAYIKKYHPSWIKQKIRKKQKELKDSA